MTRDTEHALTQACGSDTRTRAGRRRAGPRIATALLLCTGLACGADEEMAPEESLQQAAEEVSEARDEVAEAQEEVATARERLEERRSSAATAREQLEGERQEMQAAEQEVREAEQRVAALASDTAIFRTLQKDLLAAEELEESAVEVSVENRVVTLGGTVANASAEQRALELARAVPGVTRVVNRMRVIGSGDGS